MTPGQLAQVTELPSSTTTRVLDRLEDKGLVRREPDPSDRRKTWVHAVPLDHPEVGAAYESIVQPDGGGPRRLHGRGPQDGHPLPRRDQGRALSRDVPSTDLITRARDGDGDAFRALTEPHRRELHAHCYRMLGSVQDAEDAVQETLLSAWRGLAGFGEHASMRTWLYRIATNTCLNAIRATRRRPAKAWDIPGVVPPEPTRLGEVPWLGPFPDSLLEGAPAVPAGPEGRYEQAESIALAFVTALQALAPRQLAVLVLRDVMGFRSSEVADMLDTTVASVNSSLNRARSNLRARRPHSLDTAPAPAPPRRTRSRHGSSVPTRRRTCRPSSTCSPTTSSCRCPRCPSSTRAETRPLDSSTAC